MNTFYHGDCLFVMRHDIAPESIDLIYLDPPFFTGKIQKGIKKWQPGAMEISFEDSKKFWSEKAEEMRKKAPLWLCHIAIKRSDFASYLWYMMERLQACHKVLKKTGSIYLHCDYRASHYLKMIMDEIFSSAYFQNEIVWYYTVGGKSLKRFARKHDIILFYTKSNKFIFNGKAVGIPRKTGTSSFGGKIRIDEQGRRYQDKRTKDGKYYRYYLDEGKVPEDVWFLESIQSQDKERVGYPTQKPEALLERIIKASSNEGDLILDPFCGCGTTVIVASKLNRKFIGIDIHPTAFEVIKNRAHELFAQSRYISRDLSEVLAMTPKQFEDWVNEYYGAAKPYPNKGVDGITSNGIPIQVKSSSVAKYDTLSKFITDVNYHPDTIKPVKEVIIVSQYGFDDEIRKRQFEIENKEGIKINLITPKDMLEL